MVSQDANSDSNGCPIDYLGDQLEDFAEVSSCPFAVSRGVFHELVGGSSFAQEQSEHLEADMFGGIPRPLSRAILSSLAGGIPIEEVVVEDVCSSNELEEEVVSRGEEAFLEKITVNPQLNFLFKSTGKKEMNFML